MTKVEFTSEKAFSAYNKIKDEAIVKVAIWRISPSKAPLRDGLKASIIRKAWPIIGQEATRLFNRCLIESHFPSKPNWWSFQSPVKRNWLLQKLFGR